MNNYKLTYTFYGMDVTFETKELWVLSQKLDELIENPHVEPGSVKIVTEQKTNLKPTNHTI